MKYKKNIFYVFLSVLIEIGTTFIRYQSEKNDFWISYIIYFITVYLLIKKFPFDRKRILLSFLLTLISLSALEWFLDRVPPLLGLINIIGTLIACVFGFIFEHLKKKSYKFIIIILSVTLCVFYVNFGYNFWLHYLNYGNLTGKITEEFSINWPSYMQNYENIVPADFKNNKLVIFDFFNTSCGVCFAKFPILQKTFDKYKSNPNVYIYAVNIPLKRDTPGMALQIIRDRKYTFPVLLGKNKLDSIFGIQGYPTTILFRNDTIFFKGDIENVTGVIEKELRNK